MPNSGLRRRQPDADILHVRHSKSAAVLPSPHPAHRGAQTEKTVTPAVAAAFAPLSSRRIVTPLCLGHVLIAVFAELCRSWSRATATMTCRWFAEWAAHFLYHASAGHAQEGAPSKVASEEGCTHALAVQHSHGLQEKPTPTKAAVKAESDSDDDVPLVRAHTSRDPQTTASSRSARSLPLL